MKKILSVLLALFFFYGCAKDEIPHSDKLVGTVWTEESDNGDYTLYFAINHKCTYVWTPLHYEKFTSKYQYTIDDDRLVLKLGKQHEGVVDFKNGTININISDRFYTFKRVR